MKVPEVSKPTGYEQYYFRTLNLRDRENDTFFTHKTDILLTNLSQAHCYQVSIYLCRNENIRRCAQPLTEILTTDEILIPYVMTTAQKIMVYVVPVAVIAVYVGYRLFYKYRKIQKRVLAPPDPDTPLLEVIDENNYNFNMKPLMELIDGNYEIKLDDIIKGDFIGAGFFGEVFEGTYLDKFNGLEYRVAVKTVRDADRNYEKFIEEATIIKSLQTHHIVKLIGFVLKREPWIVMEYLENKDLRNYLRENKPCQELNESEETKPVAEGYARLEEDGDEL